MLTFRVLHRYLGFFLAGIMMIYAVSGITLILETPIPSNKRFKKRSPSKQASPKKHWACLENSRS